MRVVVKIAGKEALPVRAIPFLTDWKRWTPDVLASVFAGTADRALAISGSVRTFRVVEGAVVQVLPDWWLSFPVNQLAALDERLREGGEGRSRVRSDGPPEAPRGTSYQAPLRCALCALGVCIEEV